MADISQIKLPNGDTFDLIDEKSGYITAQYIENKTDYSIPVSRVGEIEVGETVIGTDSTNFPTSKAVVDYVDERVVQEIEAIDLSGYATKATTLAGYGITDAKIQNGTITLGGNTITPLTSFTETDPIFSASAAAGITSTDISNWNSKTSNTGTVTSVGLTNATNGGLTISGSPITSSGSITVGHSNVLASAQTTLGIYPIKIDKNGHISEYGSAVTIPTKVSDLTNDSSFTAKSTTTATLTTTWSSKTQTVSVTGVTASNTVVVTPAPASYNAYCEYGVYCSAQASGTLTFTCDEVPTSSLTVNVLILN